MDKWMYRKIMIDRIYEYNLYMYIYICYIYVQTDDAIDTSSSTGRI